MRFAGIVLDGRQLMSCRWQAHLQARFTRQGLSAVRMKVAGVA